MTRRAQRSANKLYRGFLPVCALDNQRLRSFLFENNSQSEFPRNFSKICQNGKRVFMEQGGKLWAGDFDTMIFPDYAPLEFSILFMEPLGNGVLLMSDRGLYYVDAELRMSKVVSSFLTSYIVKASTNGVNCVFGINDADEVFVCQLEMQNGVPIPVAQSMSKRRLDRIVWGAAPQMKFCEGTLWIAREHDVYGFHDGSWSRRHNYPTHTIRKLGSYKDRLVIFFSDNKALFDVPIVTYTKEQL